MERVFIVMAGCEAGLKDARFKEKEGEPESKKGVVDAVEAETRSTRSWGDVLGSQIAFIRLEYEPMSPCPRTNRCSIRSSRLRPEATTSTRLLQIARKSLLFSESGSEA